MKKKKGSALVLAFGPLPKKGDKGGGAEGDDDEASSTEGEPEPEGDGFDVACDEAFQAMKNDDRKAFASAMRSAIDVRRHAPDDEEDEDDGDDDGSMDDEPAAR